MKTKHIHGICIAVGVAVYTTLLSVYWKVLIVLGGVA